MAPKIQVSSIDLHIDEEVIIKIIGCLKNTELTIHASTYDEEEKKFSSWIKL